SAADAVTLRQLQVNGRRPYTEHLNSLHGDYRLVAVPGDNGTILVTGLPVGPVTETLNNVELTEVIVFAAALLLTGVIGMGWVRLSLRPLRRGAATAAGGAGLPPARGPGGPAHPGPGGGPPPEGGQRGAAVQRMAA